MSIPNTTTDHRQTDDVFSVLDNDHETFLQCHEYGCICERPTFNMFTKNTFWAACTCESPGVEIKNENFVELKEENDVEPGLPDKRYQRSWTSPLSNSHQPCGHLYHQNRSYFPTRHNVYRPSFVDDRCCYTLHEEENIDPFFSKEMLTKDSVDRISNCEILLSKIHQLCDQYVTVNTNDDSMANKKNAARLVFNALRSARDKRIFRDLKDTVKKLRRKDQNSLLKLVNADHSEMFDKKVWTILLRLAGEQFPPKIVYKLLFVHPSVNLNNSYHPCPPIRKRHDMGPLEEWFEFSVYRCSVCKTKIKSSFDDKTKRKRKKRFPSWIDEIYTR